MSVQIDSRGTEAQRYIIYDRFKQWADDGLIELPASRPGHDKTDQAMRHLCKLLGHDNVGEMLTFYTSDDAHKVMALAGPHGYSFYKLLVLKKEGRLHEREEGE